MGVNGCPLILCEHRIIWRSKYFKSDLLRVWCVWCVWCVWEKWHGVYMLWLLCVEIDVYEMCQSCLEGSHKPYTWCDLYVSLRHDLTWLLCVYSRHDLHIYLYIHDINVTTCVYVWVSVYWQHDSHVLTTWLTRVKEWGKKSETGEIKSGEIKSEEWNRRHVIKSPHHLSCHLRMSRLEIRNK